MRQAITTKFIGPTNYRGSRVKAVAAAGIVTLDWDHALNSDQNHRAAAIALAAKYEWNGKWFPGGHHDGSVTWVDASDATDAFASGEVR